MLTEGIRLSSTGCSDGGLGRSRERGLFSGELAHNETKKSGGWLGGFYCYTVKGISRPGKEYVNLFLIESVRGPGDG